MMLGPLLFTNPKIIRCLLENYPTKIKQITVCPSEIRFFSKSKIMSIKNYLNDVDITVASLLNYWYLLALPKLNQQALAHASAHPYTYIAGYFRWRYLSS